MTLSADPATEPDKSPLLTRRVWWFLLFALVSNISLSLLFSVIPLFASTSTGHSLAAGLATGAMMLATVIVELGTPRLMSQLGYRWIMAIGVSLLGFPSLLLIATSNIATILIVCAARGAGLAIIVVAGTALAAQLFPIHRRAEGLGIYGLAVSIPGILFLPLGVWLSEEIGYNAVFGIAAVMAIAGLCTVPDLAEHASRRETDQQHSLRAGQSRNCATNDHLRRRHPRFRRPAHLSRAGGS